MMNFTMILETSRRFKISLCLNALLIYYQNIDCTKGMLNTALRNIFIGTRRLISSTTDNETEALAHNYDDPINDTAAVMVLESSKLFFLLIYILIIIVLVLILEQINRKKKSLGGVLDNQEGYFIEKRLICNSNEKEGRSMTPEKELMSCEVKDEILKKLLLFEEGIRYTDKHFNLSALSVRLKTNTKYLSYIINKYKKKDFNTYINELRILYIIKKMENNPAYLNYKISYLADECGFSSHSKFTAVFKSVVGMSPSRFMDMLTKRTK